MRLEQIVGYLAALVIVGGGLLVLGAIFRFSIVSPLRTRGSRRLLRKPDLNGVTAVVGFALPAELEHFYRNSGVVEEVEFELVDTSVDPPKVWDIAAFEPLIPVVAEELCASSRARGAPIATDFSKGVYYVDANGAVQLHSPRGTTLVARSIAALACFEIRAVKE